MSGTISGLNPLIPQGILNRVRGSLQIPDFSNLNVTAPYLGPEGISLSRESPANTNLPTMTGIVPSPEPYQQVLLTVALNRTQGLASLYEQQFQANTYLGLVVVRTDAATLPTYNLYSMSLVTVGELRFNGTTPMYGIELRGYYPVNSSMFGG